MARREKRREDKTGSRSGVERASTSTTSQHFDLLPLVHSTHTPCLPILFNELFRGRLLTFFGSTDAGLAAGAPNPFFFSAATTTPIDDDVGRRDAIKEPPCRSERESIAPARRMGCAMIVEELQRAAGKERALEGRIEKDDEREGKRESETTKPSTIFPFVLSLQFDLISLSHRFLAFSAPALRFLIGLFVFRFVFVRMILQIKIWTPIRLSLLFVCSSQLSTQEFHQIGRKTVRAGLPPPTPPAFCGSPKPAPCPHAGCPSV